MNKSLLILLLLGSTGIAYSPSLRGAFVYDDQAIIVKNPLVRRPLSISKIFRTPYWGPASANSTTAQGGLYRPIPILTYALNYHIGGLRPWTFHLVNVALHMGVVLLLGALLLHLGYSESLAWSATFLFALLPIHSEAVSSIVGRAELLSAGFVLLAWIYFLPPVRPARLLIAVAALACALLSKENAVAFAPALMMGDLLRSKIPFRQTLRSRGWIWLCAIGVTVAYLAWRRQIVGPLLGVGGPTYFDETAIRSMVMTMSVFFWAHYVRPMVFGFPLCADFTRPQLSDTAFRSLGGWFAFFALAALILYALWGTIRRKNTLAFGTLIGLLFLFPVSNLLAPLEVIGAERFLYLPSIGFVLVMAFLLEHLKQFHRTLSMVCGAALMFAYGSLTWQRDRIWRTEETFWTATVQDAPRSPRAWNGRGVVRMEAGQLRQASEDFRHALKLNPELVDAHYNLATSLLLAGDRVHAKAGYEYVISQRPEDLNALNKLAHLSEDAGDKKHALAYYEKISGIDPQDMRVKQNLARLRGIRL